MTTGIRGLLLSVFFFVLLFNEPVKGQGALPVHTVNGLQHAGAVHFYALPGTLTLTVIKNDGRGDPINQLMTAMFTGPDGSILDSARLYGSTQKSLTTAIKTAGVYTLFVSMNGDQYVTSVTWGFKTNAPHYLINSGTGHADRKREEPIMLNGDDRPFGIFFAPPNKRFAVKVTALPDDAKTIALYDAVGNLLQQVNVTENQAEIQVQEGAHNGIWELRLPKQKGTVNIEGVTHDWDKDKKPLPVWTTTRDAYFKLDAYHWLVSPRRFARNVNIGDKGTIGFTLFNNSEEMMPVEIQLKGTPDIGKFTLPSNHLTIAPRTTATVDVRYELSSSVPAGIYDFQFVAKNPSTGKQAFSLVELRADTQKTVTLPIHLKLFEHDQFQFAYEPDYPRSNQFYFDSKNRPWLVSDKGLTVLIGDTWKTIRLSVKQENIHYPTSTIGTDSDGFVYTIVAIDSLPYLMRVNSHERKPELVALPPGGTYKMETFMGGKTSNYPPVVFRYRLDSTKERVSFWAKVHRLELFITSFAAGRLQVQPPVLISNNCVGISDHSGITNSVASDGDNLHVIWGETSDPAKTDPGVPTYTITYDRANGRLSAPTFLTYSPPVNDVHNMSTLLVDSKGTQHVIIGAHGRPFQYLNRRAGVEKWSAPLPMSQLGQTYVGAALDLENGIHLFCRTWRRGEYFPGTFDASLYYQQMNNDRSWEEQIPFALPALPGYSVYYHRLTVDRTGRLYLSMDYWSTWSAYREGYADAADSKRQGKNRVVFTSRDGKDWQIVTQRLLNDNISIQ